MHYTVLVKISPETYEKYGCDVFGAIDGLMSPYNANNECPKDQLVFEVEEEDVIEHAKYFYEQHEGRYGFWVNPNAKWDWYQIGGRWSAQLVIKKDASLHGFGESNEKEFRPENTADYARIADLDFSLMKQNVEEEINAFWLKIQRYRADPVGLKDFKWEAGVLADELDTVTLDDLRTKHRLSFEFYTHDVLDDNGWGELTDDQKAEFADKYLKNENPETIVAMVDYHC